MSDISLTALKAAIRRLERSDNQRKRKTARAAVRTELRAIGRIADKGYPLLAEDGSPVQKVKRLCCPICKVPLSNQPGGFTFHLQKHKLVKYGDIKRKGQIRNGWRCVCGATGTSNRGLLAHLRKAGDLKAHFATAAIIKSAGGTP